MSARGLRNNNPGNIRINTDKFDGEIQPSQDRAFKQFQSMAYGYRAMFVILGTKLAKGENTIEKIISSWAPPTENNTSAYISSVCRETGIDRNTMLTAFSGNDYIKIVAAISHVENGELAVMSDIEAGFNLQNKITR